MMIKAAIVTVSDSCAAGNREDRSGPAVAEMLSGKGFEVLERTVVPDEKEAIEAQLCQLCDRSGADVVITAGGTGLGPRDVTPEATAAVCERLIPGLSEIMRVLGWHKSKTAVLSRGVCGMRNGTVVINLPGSVKGATESLEVIIDVLVHAVEMAKGGGH